MTLQRCDAIDRTARLQFVNPAADRLRHFRRVAARADQIIWKRIGSRKTRVHGGYRLRIQPLLAGIRHYSADSSLRLEVVVRSSLKLMSDRRRTGKVTIRKAAIHDRVVGTGSLFTSLSDKNRDLHGLEISRRHVAAVGEYFATRIQTSIHLELKLVKRRNARKHARGCGRIHPWQRSQAIESPVDTLYERLHLCGLAPR